MSWYFNSVVILRLLTVGWCFAWLRVYWLFALFGCRFDGCYGCLGVV